jgi:hypothetical protein
METFLFSICCHIVGDFYLQPSVLTKKNRNFLWFLGLQSLLYTLPFFAFYFIGRDLMHISLISDFAFLFSSHLFIAAVSSRFPHLKTFCIDQMLHIIVLLLRLFLFTLKSPFSLSHVGIGLAILLLFQPSRILVTKTLDSLHMSSNFSTTIHTGYLVGYLERLIILLLCLFGSISSIVFIFTAKTIVRFPDMKENKTLQEVYLIGTFLSVLMALLSYGIILLTNST